MSGIIVAVVAIAVNVSGHQDPLSFELSIACMKELVAAGVLEHETSSNFNSERGRGWHMFVPSGGTYRYHLSCQANPQFTARGATGSRDGYLERCHLTARRVDEYWKERGRHSGEPGETGVAYACDVRSPCFGPFCPFSYFSRKGQRNECYEQLEGISMAISSCLKCNVENSKGSSHLSSSSSSLLALLLPEEARYFGVFLWGVAGVVCGIGVMTYLRRAAKSRGRWRGRVNKRNRNRRKMTKKNQEQNKKLEEKAALQQLLKHNKEM